MKPVEPWAAHIDADELRFWKTMGGAGDRQWEPQMQLARSRRAQAWGAVVTYSRKVFIPLTTLCRDSCGYCTFAKRPGEPGAGYLTPDAVMDIVKRGERLGCKEALFSLGERPELRYPEARAMLERLGYETTLDYVIAMCDRVLRESTLVPHVNAGTLSADELRRVKAVSGSAGLMLENVSRRLVRVGMAHHACPDKVPVQRLRTLKVAGELAVPTTSGILIGIGEIWDERIDSLFALASLHRAHGHLQEVIVQNFRAKPGTPMALHPEPDMADMLRTLAAARLILPADVSLQAPPNLNEDFGRYLDAGINDWGGISPLTADHINPECAWPAVACVAECSAARGLSLVERLTTYPAFQSPARGFLHPRPFVAILALAREDGWSSHQAHASNEFGRASEVAA
jgi:7,8-didemethyl-8-hydroxy-5-deazariboflavin synthase CofG subunit